MNLKLLSIVCTDPEDETAKYVHAFSFRLNQLNELLNTCVTEEKRHLYTIEPVEMFEHIEYFSNDTAESKQILIVMLQTEARMKTSSKDIYGVYVGNKQALLLTHQPDFVKENSNVLIDIADCPVKIDTFYPEGILNAC